MKAPYRQLFICEMIVSGDQGNVNRITFGKSEIIEKNSIIKPRALLMSLPQGRLSENKSNTNG
jgi:hypothetical protein